MPLSWGPSRGGFLIGVSQVGEELLLAAMGGAEAAEARKAHGRTKKTRPAGGEGGGGEDGGGGGEGGGGESGDWRKGGAAFGKGKRGGRKAAAVSEAVGALGTASRLACVRGPQREDAKGQWA